MQLVNTAQTVLRHVLAKMADHVINSKVVCVPKAGLVPLVARCVRVKMAPSAMVEEDVNARRNGQAQHVKTKVSL